MEVTDGGGRMPFRTWALLAVVLVAGAGLRFYDLGGKSLWFDEGSSLRYAEMHGIGQAFDTSLTYDPPLFPALLKGWVALVDATIDPPPLSAARDAALRGLPLLFGILAMGLVFVVTRLALRHDTAAVVATLLYAVSPYQIRYAQELRNYTMWTVLGLAALYLLVRAVRENRLWQWAGLAAAEALMLYTHFFSAWFILAFNLYIVVVLAAGKRLRDERAKPWLVSQAAAAVVSAPVLLMLLRVARIVGNIKYHWYPLHGPKVALIAFKSFFAGFSPNSTVYWPLFLLAAVFFVLGLYALRRRWQMAVLLGSIVAVPLAGNVALTYLNQYSLYELRLFILSGVAAYVLVGAGVASLPRGWLRGLAAAALGVMMLWEASDYYAGRLHPVEAHRIGIWDKVDLRDAARYVRDHAQDGDVVGHPGHFSQQPFVRYLPDMPQCALGHSDIEQQVLIDNLGSEEVVRKQNFLPQPVQDVAGRFRRIWFIEAGGINFNWPPLVKSLREWLDTNAVREDFQQFDSVSVSCYDTKDLWRAEVPREQREDCGNGWTVALSRPPEFGSGSSFTSCIAFHNLGASPKTFDCSAFLSAGAIDPLAWRRKDPLTNPWKPAGQYDPETNGMFNRPSMMAMLDRRTAAAEMRGWAVLPPGRYVPFVRVYEEESGAARAAATLSLASTGRELGTLSGRPESGGSGWHWRRLGAFDAPGGMIWFTMTARNSQNLDTACAQIERILFVEESEAGSEPAAQELQLEVPPGGVHEVELEEHANDRGMARIDFEAFDPGTRTYGTLVFDAKR